MAGRGHYEDRHHDIAFGVWRKCANVEEAVKRLSREHDLPIVRSTLERWMRKYDWHKRKALLDAEEQRIRDAKASGEASILGDLYGLKTWYDDFFRDRRARADGGVPEPVHPAINAYTTLCRTIIAVSREVGESMGQAEEAHPTGLSSAAVDAIRQHVLGAVPDS